MTAPAPTRRQKVEEREEAILAAARHIFAENGPEGARMADIAKRAGIAEGTIYIYYKTKNDLLRAFVAKFWSDLTIHARDAIRQEDETFAVLEALTRFHLLALIERHDIVELNQRIRSAGPGAPLRRQDIKTYVAVFDEWYRRGMDRGDLIDTVPVWVARDLFYGTLEYSARTMMLHATSDPDPVVDNLVAVFRMRFGKALAVVSEPRPEEQALLERLETAVTRLESLKQ